MDTVGIQQQHGSERAASLFFDNQTQCIQDLLQRDSSRDHLQELFLSREQSFTLFALADIAQNRLEISAAYPRHGYLHRNDLPVFTHKFSLESYGGPRS
jgi:hypothetical protein